MNMQTHRKIFIHFHIIFTKCIQGKFWKWTYHSYRCWCRWCRRSQNYTYITLILSSPVKKTRQWLHNGQCLVPKYYRSLSKSVSRAVKRNHQTIKWDIPTAIVARTENCWSDQFLFTLFKFILGSQPVRSYFIYLSVHCSPRKDPYYYLEGF